MREIKFRVWIKETKRMDCGGPMSTFSNPHYLSNVYTNVFLQFTGLKDKNGVEIYEGDILQKELYDNIERTAYYDNIKRTDYVKYDASVAAFCIQDTTLEDFLDSFTKVIGNIYENPELLEKN